MIDADGLEDRAVAFPVPAGRYRDLRAAPNGVWWLSEPLTGTLGAGRAAAAPPERPTLHQVGLREPPCRRDRRRAGLLLRQRRRDPHRGAGRRVGARAARRPQSGTAGRRRADPGRSGPDPDRTRPGGRVATDGHRVMAADARPLLAGRHGRRRLGRGAVAVSPTGRRRRRARRCRRPDLGAPGRTQYVPRLRDVAAHAARAGDRTGIARRRPVAGSGRHLADPPDPAGRLV